jgi:proteasome accessory factor B
MRAVEIAQACGVDRRTVYRDISLLNDAGIPIAQTYGRFYIDRDQYLANIRLNFQEILALLFAASTLTRQSSDHNPYLAGVVNKLIHAMPAPAFERVSYLPTQSQDIMPQEHLKQEIFRNVIDTIVRAWIEQRIVRVKYASRGGKPRLFELAVYLIDSKPNGTLYVVGFDMLSERIISLKLERVRKVKALSTSYQIPSGFEARLYLWKHEQKRFSHSA